MGPDSVNVTVKDLVHEVTISYREIFLAARSLFLSHRQEYLDSYLAPFTPSQQGTIEMREEVLSSIGAQDMTQRGIRCLLWAFLNFTGKNCQLDLDAVTRPGIDTPFSPTAPGDLEMGGSAENSIVLDEE